MANRLLYVASLIATLACFIGYLLYAPHSEGIAQMNRIRAITAPMKLAHLIVRLFCIVNPDQWFVLIGTGRGILWYI